MAHVTKLGRFMVVGAAVAAAFCLIHGANSADGAAVGSQPEQTNTNADPLAGFGSGPIVLDPICERAGPEPPLAPGNPAPGTRRMAQRLKEIGEKIPPESAVFMSDRLAQIYLKQINQAKDPQDRVMLAFALAVQQINSGRPDSALNTLDSMERMLSRLGGGLDPQSRAEVQVRKGMALLRLGEQENCLANQNADSCLFPLQPRGFHLLPRGSRGAVAVFKAQLAENPKDLSARWLLNLAQMTLGEYPDKVDPKYLIPPEKFRSEYQLPRFVDVSPNLGLNLNDLAGGAIVDDFDNDGFYDVVVSAMDLSGQLRYFRNNGNGSFTERTSEAGLVGEVGSLNIQQTDYNNDGLLDIWMLRGAWLGKAGRMPNSLLRNNGDGTFTDVTEEAGLFSLHPTQSSRWFDYDGDGWLDVFIGNESLDDKDPDRCELYHNNRDGTFTEVAKACGVDIARFVKGVACADYDNDGRPDLFLSLRAEGQNILLHNDGPDASGQWGFSDATKYAGVAANVISFGTFFFDYDNDGWEDLIFFGYFLPNGVGDVAADYLGLPHPGAKTKLYHNNRDGTFTDVSAAAHLDRVCHTMGHNYGDLDNDGWLDFYCATGDPDFRTLVPNLMFRNDRGKVFQDVTTVTGTGHLQKGHGVSFADFDDDGDQDIYAAMGGAYSGDVARNVLFLNPGSTNHWLKLKLVGVKANRPAIGARINVTCQTPQGTRDLHRVVSSGGSFGSNPLRQEIGLADATAVSAVEIRWPGSSARQTVTGLQVDRSYEIREGDATPRVLKLQPVRLDRARPSQVQARQDKL